MKNQRNQDNKIGQHTRPTHPLNPFPSSGTSGRNIIISSRLPREAKKRITKQNHVSIFLSSFPIPIFAVSKFPHLAGKPFHIPTVITHMYTCTGTLCRPTHAHGVVGLQSMLRRIGRWMDVGIIGCSWDVLRWCMHV